MIFVLDGLNALKWIKIEKNSFTKVDDSVWKDPNILTADRNDPKKSFHIMKFGRNALSGDRSEIIVILLKGKSQTKSSHCRSAHIDSSGL